MILYIYFYELIATFSSSIFSIVVLRLPFHDIDCYVCELNTNMVESNGDSFFMLHFTISKISL